MVVDCTFNNKKNKHSLFSGNILTNVFQLRGQGGEGSISCALAFVFLVANVSGGVPGAGAL